MEAHLFRSAAREQVATHRRREQPCPRRDSGLRKKRGGRSCRYPLHSLSIPAAAEPCSLTSSTGDNDDCRVVVCILKVQIGRTFADHPGVSLAEASQDMVYLQGQSPDER